MSLQGRQALAVGAAFDARINHRVARMLLRDVLDEISHIIEGLAALNAAVGQMLELVLTSCVVDVGVQRGERRTRIHVASMTPELDLSSSHSAIAVEVNQQLLQRAVSLMAEVAFVREVVPGLDFVLAEPGDIDFAVIGNVSAFHRDVSVILQLGMIVRCSRELLVGLIVPSRKTNR